MQATQDTNTGVFYHFGGENYGSALFLWSCSKRTRSNVYIYEESPSVRSPNSYLIKCSAMNVKSDFCRLCWSILSPSWMPYFQRLTPNYVLSSRRSMNVLNAFASISDMEEPLICTSLLLIKARNTKRNIKAAFTRLAEIHWFVCIFSTFISRKT